MAAQRATEGSTKGKPRPAPVVEAVLALVIERPSYSFNLWKRYEARFHELYPLSKPRIYQVLDRLLDHGLIEVMDADADADAPRSRQPRIAYRATARGARAHREWLAASIQEDPRREELLRRLLGTGARDARAMLQIVDAYERTCLDDMARPPGAQDAVPLPSDDETFELRDRLIAEERRLAREAQIKFIAFARRSIRAVLDDNAPKP
jgi:DNA-binding PadR family transcriptional regulator